MSGYDEPERAPRALSAVTVVLTAAAGALNVVTFFSFNQVFSSTMSGNLVLVGLRLGEGNFSRAGDSLLAIVGYCAGLVVGTVFCGRMMRRLPWRSAVGAALTLELALLIALGIVLFAVDQDLVIEYWSLVTLVAGSGLAMGVQSAATRYIGPTGTPTSFLSGTVTNWVCGLADLRGRSRWDWNSPLRIGVVIVAAAGNTLVLRVAPVWSYAVPVILVAVAVGLMAAVVRANHDGLFTGTPQLAASPRDEQPA